MQSSRTSGLSIATPLPHTLDMFDLLITGGQVVDGSGSPWFRADLGIRGERIEAVGNLAAAAAKRRLDVTGRVVAPGFIDTHVHGDLALLADPTHESAIHQGITTYIIGQDGCGMAPASPTTIEYMRQYTAGFTGKFPQLECRWRTLDEYLASFHRRTSLNVAYLVPNGTVRMEAMGLETRPPNGEELKTMRRLVREAMDQGAVGLSTGLDYIPSKYAAREEIAALAKEITDGDGVYVSHVRAHGGPKWHEALDELAFICQTSGCLGHVSHFNVQAEKYLPRIDAMRRLGLDVTFDTYPYLAGMTILAMIVLPDSVQEGGVAATLKRLKDKRTRAEVADFIRGRTFASDLIRLAGIGSDRFAGLEGRTLTEACRETGMDIGELACELLFESQLAASAVVFDGKRTERDLIACMRHAAQMGSSDGIFTGKMPHPRGYGAFARFISEYVRKRNAWSLEEAVRHLTHHPARRYRLPDRGLLAKGMVADVIVFDPETFEDRASYANPKVLAAGMDHVLVAGQLTLENGKHTGVTNGQALRRAT
ncbi:MAG: D-aminoacylase [Planctomycetota bacterium]